jgi:hypothetical protein
MMMVSSLLSPTIFTKKEKKLEKEGRKRDCGNGGTSAKATVYIYQVTSPKIVILSHTLVKYPSRLTFSICTTNPFIDVDRTAILLSQKSIVSGTKHA